MKNRYYEMKVHALKVFPTYYYDKFQKLCRKAFFTTTFFYICEKSRNLLRDSEPKDVIFFKKLKSISECLKNNFRQMKPTSYRYF